MDGNHRGVKTAKQHHPAAFRRLRAGGTVGQFARSEGHRTVAQSGTFRAAVFGVNYGLVSNLGLVMGVAGASTGPTLRLVSRRCRTIGGCVFDGRGRVRFDASAARVV